MLTGSQELIRDINTQSIIRTIIADGPISRTDIASALGLTKATVSAIVQLLLDRGLILETGADALKKTPSAAHGRAFQESRKGRRPILLQINKKCGHVISIELGTDMITLLTADLMGADCALTRFAAPKDDGELLSVLKENIDRALARLPKSRHGLLGIAVAIHGVVHHNKIMFLPYSSYEKAGLVPELEKAYHVPVFMENEANLSVLGEWAYCHNTNEMLYISVHSGIGLGIIMRSQLVKGKNGYAGEFGHTIIEAGGRPCPCGNRGCLEQYASERALFADLSQKKGAAVNAELFGQLLRQKDTDAIAAMDSFIQYMAIGINNLLNTFNPDVIVLNSSLTMYHASLCADIEAGLHNNMRHYCRLVPSTLQDTASLLGGVYLVSNRFLYPTEL